MCDLSDDDSDEDEDEKRRLRLAKEIARRQSEPAANFAAKSRSKNIPRFRSPPPMSCRARQSSSSSTEEDGEIIPDPEGNYGRGENIPDPEGNYGRGGFG